MCRCIVCVFGREGYENYGICIYLDAQVILVESPLCTAIHSRPRIVDYVFSSKRVSDFLIHGG
jgi:hypothetical protein